MGARRPAGGTRRRPRSSVAALALAVAVAVSASAQAGADARDGPAARAGGQIVYRASASLTVNERFPELTGDCRSTGSRQIHWRQSVLRILLIGPPGSKALATLQPAPGRFETFESRVVSPCPGEFTNRFGGAPFRLSVAWVQQENRFHVTTETDGLDEGEGGGWTHKGCTPGGRTSELLELGGTPHYTTAETSLTAAERGALLAGRALTVRRSVSRRFPSSACGFGGDHFDVTAALEVQLTPLRGPGGGGAGGSGCTIDGTPRDDVLVGTARRDVICGGAGNDVIRGRGGNDLLRGGAGADRVSGDAGHDVVDGGPASDRLAGDAGNDTLRARDRRRDTVAGGPGRDGASVDRGLDRVSGVERVR